MAISHFASSACESSSSDCSCNRAALAARLSTTFRVPSAFARKRPFNLTCSSPPPESHQGRQARPPTATYAEAWPGLAHNRQGADDVRSQVAVHVQQSNVRMTCQHATLAAMRVSTESHWFCLVQSGTLYSLHPFSEST